MRLSRNKRYHQWDLAFIRKFEDRFASFLQVPQQTSAEAAADGTEAAETGGDAEGLDFLDEDSSDDEEVVVKIGDIKQNVPFQKSAPIGGAPKVDLDGQPTHKGTMIYDLDLASMEEKPWRKPGADVTDYFNYGFNEGQSFSLCIQQENDLFQRPGTFTAKDRRNCERSTAAIRRKSTASYSTTSRSVCRSSALRRVAASW